MKRLSAYRLVVLASFASVVFLAPTVAVALTTGSEFVTGTLFTAQYTDAGNTFGPFATNFSYIRSFDGASVAKDVQINFVFDAALGFDVAQQAAYRATVEGNIEGIWNNKYVIVDTAKNSVFPVVVDVTTTGPRFDQSVAVHPGSGRADVQNWFVGDSASVNAHEFGHMLGLFDEYIGGSVDRYPNPTLSDAGLMGLGALSATPEMLPRYYDQYLGYISTLNPDSTFQLAQVPEPSTLILVSLGSSVALLVRGWRSRYRG
jgi:hypothetical protein